jgi:predicted DNA-binding ribbon-helix-helix protein
MRSAVSKHSIRLRGRKTSVSLENEFWVGLREIAGDGNVSLFTLVEQIDRDRATDNLSSAIRLFVFNRLRLRTDRSGVKLSPDLTQMTQDR